MDFFDVIKNRYSVRAYRTDPVEPEKLEKILEAARIAPSACNRQPYEIIVIDAAGFPKDKLARIYGSGWFLDAPVILAVCAKREDAWSRDGRKNYGDVDCAIAMDHLILAATALGLGTCWIGAFNEQAARDVLNLPEKWEPVAFTPLGYAACPMPPKRRKPQDEILIRK